MQVFKKWVNTFIDERKNNFKYYLMHESSS